MTLPYRHSSINCNFPEIFVRGRWCGASVGQTIQNEDMLFGAGAVLLLKKYRAIIYQILKTRRNFL